MAKPRRPIDESSQRREIDDLRRRLAALETGNRAGFTAVDRGTMVFGSTPNGPQIYFGTLPNGDNGLIVRRMDGSIALQMGKPFPGDSPQLMWIYDRAGNLLFGDAYLTSWGAVAPRMSYAVRPVDGTDEKSVAATTWTTVFRADFDAHNPQLKCRLQARVSVADTAGELRLADASGNPLGSFLRSQNPVPIPLGSLTNVEYESDVCQVPASAPGDAVAVLVQVQRTAGTGNVIVRPGAIIGMAL